MTGPSHLSREPFRPDTLHWQKAQVAEPKWDWPDQKRVAVTLSFDVDAETGWFSVGDEYLDRIGSLSESRFGVIRGLPRILDLFRRYELKTTFFVPGWVAENYPFAVEKILEGGHEIGHHGYVHTPPNAASAEIQREEIERGFTALEAVGAPRPRGYRAPGGEVTPETFALLVEAGFLYDSSFLGDDRPYIEKHQELELLELPWHWSLDDWPYFSFAADSGGNQSAAAVWRQNLWAEYQQARDEGRGVNFVCHPEFIGRGYRFRQLESLLEAIVEDGQAWIPTLEELAHHVSPLLGIKGTAR